MRKEVIICDRCKRQLSENEKHITIPKNSSSPGYQETEDICKNCQYLGLTSNNVWVIK